MSPQTANFGVRGVDLRICEKCRKVGSALTIQVVFIPFMD